MAPTNSDQRAGAASTWDGNAMTQTDMMEKDTVLVLDSNDNVIGSESKRASHEFESSQPRGVLHRAFSVFLFDESDGRLLLQKRASTKITFPNVWTNTCCSHPLHGMSPPEVDSPQDVADGTVPGAKNAAVRKLLHELGIPSEQVPVEKFKFLTRLHYWAADTVTHGKKSPWGEHEIDYVLFFTVPSKSVLTVTPHPDEVDDVKWVTKTELLDMMADPNLLFSPWFRLIAQRWMIPKGGWWDDLNQTMTTNVLCDFKAIHAFDPPKEHMGGGGDAGPVFGEGGEGKKAAANGTIARADSLGDTTKKQGAYGKLMTHKESKLSQILRMDEVWSAVTLMYIKPLKSNLDTEYVRTTYNSSDLAFCDEILCKVSRSFAAVIRQLPPTLLVDVLVFYLVLRALDTIEDDMTAFDSNDEKVKILMAFHKTALVDPTWSMDGVGEADEKRLLQHFPKCHSVYAALNPQSRRVIADITQRMATGMAEFVGKDLGQGTVDVGQYNRYCHFVAGLVGEGLSRLFAASGLEKPSMAKELHLSDQMGLFLQKTNIIRDYLEDYVDGRAFWPQSIWKKYSKSGDLGYFADQSVEEVRAQSLCCLNELVTDALELAPDCLAYLSRLQCAEVFRFCAIPQVMAIATLDKCYGNLDVFTGVVKIRKGLSCKLINDTNDMPGVHGTFHSFATSVARAARKARDSGIADPSYERTIKACDAICELTEVEASRRTGKAGMLFNCTLAATCAAGCVYLSKGGSDRTNNQMLFPALAVASLGIGSAMKMMGLRINIESSTSSFASLKPADTLSPDCSSSGSLSAKKAH